MRKPITFLAMTFGVLAAFASFLLAAFLAFAGLQGAGRSPAAALQVRAASRQNLILQVQFDWIPAIVTPILVNHFHLGSHWTHENLVPTTLSLIWGHLSLYGS